MQHKTQHDQQHKRLGAYSDTQRREPGAKEKGRGEGIQTPDPGSVRRGREPGAKERGRDQSQVLSEEGVSQEPKRREGVKGPQIQHANSRIWICAKRA